MVKMPKSVQPKIVGTSQQSAWSGYSGLGNTASSGYSGFTGITISGYSGPSGITGGWSGTSGGFITAEKNNYDTGKIESVKYFWVKSRKSGKMFLGMEEIRNYKNKTKITAWQIYGQTGESASGCIFSGDEGNMTTQYEVIDEVCPTTTQW
jgi:hypothetical protein